MVKNCLKECLKNDQKREKIFFFEKKVNFLLNRSKLEQEESKEFNDDQTGFWLYY